MKIFFSLLTFGFVLMSASSHAAGLEYTEGSLEGKPVEHTGYLGYYDVCYTGNPWKVRTMLNEMALESYEKIEIRVWLNTQTKVIEFDYVDTKCLDDSLDATYSSCKVEVIIPKCSEN
ncbi:MAG: hypothetical protein CME65_02580 [Halobacteriovoraceae bacterium]|nr:hypothetical protein [Halobacteriovoraceae bacterium]|tara:strand:+ start:9285 stop:9638 length:354 start_codon:yes stop_codon:yes gene_type:complete